MAGTTISHFAGQQGLRTALRGVQPAEASTPNHLFERDRHVVWRLRNNGGGAVRPSVLRLYAMRQLTRRERRTERLAV
jgi:hypothetical protein